VKLKRADGGYEAARGGRRVARCAPGAIPGGPPLWVTGIGTIEEATAAPANTSGENSPSLFEDPLREALGEAEEPLRRLASISDATLSDIARAREAAIDAKTAIAPVAGLFDLIVAACLGEAEIPTVLSHQSNRVSGVFMAMNLYAPTPDIVVAS
jgi:hypothetical protein